jgi:pyruvate/2-oxoglutarate dehydrogenase complex dihydrolipoamide dehydrogenase (E3) component
VHAQQDAPAPGARARRGRRIPGAREAVTGELDVAAALARRDWVTGGWDDAGQVSWLETAGGTLVRGHGRLAGGRVVEVDQPDGSTRRLTARRAVVIATGSAAAIPPIDGCARSATGTAAT